MNNIIPPFEISVGESRKAPFWKRQKTTWQELVKRCAVTKRTEEAMAEYLAKSREEQSNIKDVGGFVGATLADGARRSANVISRTLLTIDVDNATPELIERLLIEERNAMCIYSTHKHTPESCRVRITAPLSRYVTADEYVALSRMYCRERGLMEAIDPTTHEVARLFYWPSTPCDGEFLYEVVEGPAVDVDALLDKYDDWRDTGAWPLSPGENEPKGAGGNKHIAEDPREKEGIIGLFCRCYSIDEAIRCFLQDVYAPAGKGRYTYKPGTVSGGLVVYDGVWAFANNATDPAAVGHHSVNAFDLVRIHRFGELDKKARTDDPTALPSYGAMSRMAGDDPVVRRRSVEESMQKANDFFDVVGEELQRDEAHDDDGDGSWMEQLKLTNKGKVEPSSYNIEVLLRNHPEIKGHLWHDDFTHFDYVEGGFMGREGDRPFDDSDMANLRHMLSRDFGISGKDKVDDALSYVKNSWRRHPIKEYLLSLKWDGVKRLDRIFIDYLGAEDTPLHRAVGAMGFTAAVERIFAPGCKYDYCPMIIGPEGCGKSTLLQTMGGDWFSDSLTEMTSKDAREQLQTAWLFEIGELVAVKRSDITIVKSFISARQDTFRPTYGRKTTPHPRHCVFFSTSNEEYCLKGDDGNRRFIPIYIKPELRKYANNFEAMRQDRDQLWAEAVEYYKANLPLYLAGELEAEARALQKRANVDAEDPVRAELRLYVDTPVPTCYGIMTVAERKNFFQNGGTSIAGTVRRDRVAPVEFIRERLNIDSADKRCQSLCRKVAKYLKEMGWAPVNSSRHCEAQYGRQKAYDRPECEKTDEDEIL